MGVLLAKVGWGIEVEDRGVSGMHRGIESQDIRPLTESPIEG